MQFLSNSRKFARVLGSSPSILLNSNHRFLSSLTPISSASLSSLPWQFHTETSSGMCRGSYLSMPQHPVYTMMSRACFSTGAETSDSNPTEAVKELYDNMLESVNVKRTMPPNASLWSMIGKCKNMEDIKLLFDALKNLRRFRLSNLRIHSNFNCNLCQEVARACVRVGTIDFGKRTLWNHNVYGLSPSIASAHHLLSYAKVHNDTKILVEIMHLVKRNNLPLQPGTADIVSSICYNTNNWELISKYSKRFIKAGVKLRPTTFETWMKFAAQRGDTEALWNIEKLRSETLTFHTLTTGISCAKGLLLESKPEDAATLIQVLNQTLSETKKAGIKDEIENLVNEWPSEVIKHKKEEDRKALAASLKSDIPAMIASLLNMGLTMSGKLEDLTKKELL
ncbi:hypothetical protein CCACVL1_28411 [Corchorus capsularis]|uniref:Uncharacterized protein n=1 Tax=Corchorus capsularis TaxID=210143 RepID=A0A1R3G6L1_COCAP|nr:hypothetical protein CCACVL1_28411 [Corchorus capsularis]